MLKPHVDLEGVCSPVETSCRDQNTRVYVETSCHRLGYILRPHVDYWEPMLRPHVARVHVETCRLGSMLRPRINA